MLSPTQRRNANRGALKGVRSASLRTEVAIPQRYTQAGLVEAQGEGGTLSVVNYSPYLPRFGSQRPGVVSNGVVGWMA